MKLKKKILARMASGAGSECLRRTIASGHLAHPMSYVSGQIHQPDRLLAQITVCSNATIPDG
jgi:hypothetical protein